MGDEPARKQTALHARHVALGAKMVPFAGYDMPVNYPAGIVAEHTHTRGQAGLFDVSHMGQVRLVGARAAAALETLVPADIQGIAPSAMRYTQFTNEAGGILDDLMVANRDDHLALVVNAACKDADIAHLKACLPAEIEVDVRGTFALIALQGPAAAGVLARHAPGCADMPFMGIQNLAIGGVDTVVSRSGYTGEDGYEISCENGHAADLWELLLREPEVAPIGLGARDSLRLEAGLCLYGHDIDEATSPIEAGLAWSIGKRRREEGGFPGAPRILAELRDGPARKRVGIKPEGRAPAREHTPILSGAGAEIGKITSGGFGPSANGPVAMGYVDAAHAAVGTKVDLMLRGKARPAEIVKLPFIAHNYHRA